MAGMTCQIHSSPKERLDVLPPLQLQLYHQRLQHPKLLQHHWLLQLERANLQLRHRWLHLLLEQHLDRHRNLELRAQG